MTYGKSMHDWEAREDERRERIWLSDLASAINLTISHGLPNLRSRD